MELSEAYYVASAHKASAVTASVKAAFTSPDAINLLIAKNHHLEIYEVRLNMQAQPIRFLLKNFRSLGHPRGPLAHY